MTRLPGHDSGFRRAVDIGQGVLEQGGWNRAAGTGPEQDISVRSGHLGQDIWDRTPETGWTGQVGLIGNLNRTART
jgi:hypothetical protein